MLKLAIDGIIGFSSKPLKIIGGIGMLSIMISFAVLIYSILSYIFNWNNLMPGWTSIMVKYYIFCRSTVIVNMDDV